MFFETLMFFCDVLETLMSFSCCFTDVFWNFDVFHRGETHTPTSKRDLMTTFLKVLQNPTILIQSTHPHTGKISYNSLYRFFSVSHYKETYPHVVRFFPYEEYIQNHQSLHSKLIYRSFLLINFGDLLLF